MKNKGFTMIELLATMVIIGILSTIGVVSVINFRKNQEIKYNQNQIKMFVETAKTYFNDNRKYLPQEPLGNEYVTLKELKELKYVTEEFVDYHGKKYSDDSKVTVTKMGNELYGYKGSLIDFSGEVIITPNPKVLNKEIIYTKKKSDNNYVVLSSKNGNYYSNKETRVRFKVTSDISIGAYIYKIYRDGKLMTTSEAKYVDLSTSQDVSIVIKTDEYPDSKYTVKLVLYDKNGTPLTISSDKVVIDRVAPTKPILENAYENKWTNLSYSINGTTTEKGSGIEKWQYTYEAGAIEEDWTTYENSAKKEYTTTDFSAERNQKVYIRACDYAGNCSESNTSMIKIDKTEPEITKLTNPTSINGSLTNVSWTNESFSLRGEAKDTGGKTEGGSGIEYWYWGWGSNPKTISYDRYDDSYEKTSYTTTLFSKERNNEQVIIRVCDKAGNCSDSNSTSVRNSKSTNIKIDKTNPECSVSGGGNSWSLTAVTVTATCKDSLSGCTDDTKTFSHRYADDINTTTAGAKGNNVGGTVYDKAGNSASCAADRTVRVDVHDPECGSFSGGDTSWKNTPVTVTVGCSDSGSGCTSSSYPVVTYSGDIEVQYAQLSYTIRDNAGRSKTCYTASNYPIYYDHVGPTCSSSGGSTAWTNNSRTLVGTCSDSGSGCVGDVSRVIDYDVNSETMSPGWVYDNAGNSEFCPSTETVRIDKTPPSTPIITNPREQDWANKSWMNNHEYKLSVSTTENGSGVASWYYSYSSNPQSGCTDATKCWIAYSSSNSKSYTTTPFTKNRENDVYIRACDYAGNCSTKSSTWIAIDTQAPSCTPIAKLENNSGATYTSGSWTSNNIYTKPSCSDPKKDDFASGCDDNPSVTVTGASSNVTDSYQSTRMVEKKGLSHVTWKVYDEAGNSATCSTIDVNKGIYSADCNACREGSCLEYNCCAAEGVASYNSWKDTGDTTRMRVDSGNSSGSSNTSCPSFLHSISSTERWKGTAVAAADYQPKTCTKGTKPTTCICAVKKQKRTVKAYNCGSKCTCKTHSCVTCWHY